MAALEQQLRSEIKSTTHDQATAVASRGTADEATVRRVQQLIADAEQRHNREIATRLIDLQRDMTMQRRADITKAKTELGYAPTSIRAAIHDAYADFARRGLVPSKRGVA